MKKSTTATEVAKVMGAMLNGHYDDRHSIYCGPPLPKSPTMEETTDSLEITRYAQREIKKLQKNSH